MRTLKLWTETIVVYTLVAATAIVALVIAARADGAFLPPPLYGPPPFVQLPPKQSCVETAIQLGYQTGNPRVATAAVEACRIYAPVRMPYSYYGPPALGGYPSPYGPAGDIYIPQGPNGYNGNGR